MNDGSDGTTFSQALERAEALCRARTVRLTGPRRRVLEIVWRAARPIGAYEILDVLREEVTKPTPTMVYRALEFLRQQGIIHRIETLHAFVACTHPDRPHASQFLICGDCGGVRELDDASVGDSLGRAAARVGFHPQRPVVEVIGTCGGCTGKSGTQSRQ